MSVSRRADVFRDLLTRMGSVNRVELQTVTDEALVRLGDARTFIEELEETPADFVAVLALFDLALESWSDGTSGLTEHLLAAADGDEGLGLADLVVDDLLELRAGDRLYQEMVAALAAADVTQPVSPLPDIRFLPESFPVGPAAQTLLAQARVDGSPLSLDAALAIEQVTTVPEWVLDTEGSLVLDAIDQLVIKAVVTNAGNARSDASTVSAELAGGDGSAQASTADVPVLEAGAKTTVTFEPLAVTPGRSYSLVVQLALAPGEGETDDNSRTLLFRVNEGTVTTTTTAGG